MKLDEIDKVQMIEILVLLSFFLLLFFASVNSNKLYIVMTIVLLFVR